MRDLEVITKKTTHAQLPGTSIEEFKSRFRGDVLRPGDNDYDDVRIIWNGMHDKRPALIARCTGVADVIEAVNFSRNNNLLVAVRGGGHNVAGSASCDGGIMIDLSLMKGIRVNQQSRTVHAQGGATWGDLDRETQIFGLAAPGGVVSTTGIAGLTLGGGLGWLRRKHGLSIDNLLSVDIVTADGQFYTASQNENPELFWGVRGGGGNFGVVTSFEFQLHPVGPMVTLCAPWYPAEMAQTLIPAWREFMSTAPEELSSNAMFWTVPPSPNFPPETHGKRVVIFAAVYIGPIEVGERITTPLRELATPLIDLSGPIPWTALQSAFDPFFPKKVQLYYFKSRYLSNLNAETINAIIPLATNPPAPMVLIAIWHYGGAMSRKGPDETAFTGRDAPFLLSVDAIWNDPDKTQEVVGYSRHFLNEMEAYSTGGMYVNFAGLGEEGEALVRSAYGANYERLVALKNKYDPTNLFRLNQNIKPTGEKIETDSKLSLYERLGGETGLKKIVNDILDKNFNNPLIGHHFRNIDMGKLKQLVFEFFSMGIGGPHQYTGRDMRSSHADLKITHADFESGNDDVLLALEENGIGVAEQNEVIAILNSMKGDVITNALHGETNPV